jgi:glutamate synthase (NADPH/NADH) small chain
MGKPTGFLEYTRFLPKKRDPKERIKDYKELYLYDDFGENEIQIQAARCMNCGIPFCHNGCPLGNIIPEFNDAVYEKNWELAYEILISTNNFPEFTGRICPAPCEASCVLGINQPPITIEEIEKNIIETAFKRGLVKPQVPKFRTGKKIAIVGSGPAGLAAAAQLNKAGHWVTVFERADEVGGLLRYGIPDFKLEKWVVDRRINLLRDEGIEFRVNSNVGVNISVDELKNEYDALILAGGSTIPRDIPIPGRHYKGIHFAMEFLSQQNKRVANKEIKFDHTGNSYKSGEIWATGKHVVVIGGGDTGSDCVGTANRHGAKSVTQLELLPKPPEGKNEKTPWPNWPMILRTSTSHEEGCERKWSVLTKEFIGDEEGNLRGLKLVDVLWENNKMTEIPNSERIIPCDLALIAAGFLYPQKEGLLEQLDVELDERGNVKTQGFQTSVPKVFAAGDMRRGQSLVVWAISEGRECARAVDEFLMGHSLLESKDKSLLYLED